MIVLSLDCGQKNLAYCIIRDGEEIMAWELVDLDFKTMNGIPEAAVRALDRRDLLHADHVLIEIQPSKNPKMRMLQHVIHTYFTIRGIVDNSFLGKVIPYCAKRKLGQDHIRGKTNYGTRKRRAVELAKTWLENNPQREHFMKLWETSAKKDDLADCLLQALSYDGILPTIDTWEEPKIVARKPTPKQERQGYSVSNLKYLVNQSEDPEALRGNAKVFKGMMKHFGSFDRGIEKFSPP